MKMVSRIAAGLAVAAGAWTASAQDVAEGQWINLFDGETTFGWTQIGDVKWSVAEGVLTGEDGNGGKRPGADGELGDGPAVGEHESGGGGGEGLDGALGAGVLGVAFEEFEEQDGEEGWGDHGEVAGECASGAVDVVADADEESAVGTGAHAGDGDGGGELGVGDGVMGDDEVLADGGECSAAGEGGEGGFEEDEVEGEGGHSPF